MIAIKQLSARPFLVVASLLVAQPVAAFQFLDKQLLTPLELEIGRYVFENYRGSYYIPFVERVDAGDTISLVNLRKVHSRSDCFPQSTEPRPFPLVPVSNVDEHNLVGAFEASAGIDVAGEIALREDTTRDFVAAESRTFDGVDKLGTSPCPELRDLSSYTDSESVILIRRLLYLQGELGRMIFIEVTGELAVDVEEKLSAYLSGRFKGILSKLDLKGALAGSMERTTVDSTALASLTAVALTPEYINAGIAERYEQLFGEERLAALDAAEGDPASAQAFLQGFAEEVGGSDFEALVALPGDVPSLLHGDGMVRFNLENEQHVNALSLSGRLLLLAHEASFEQL